MGRNRAPHSGQLLTPLPLPTIASRCLYSSLAGVGSRGPTQTSPGGHRTNEVCQSPVAVRQTVTAPTSPLGDRAIAPQPALGVPRGAPPAVWAGRPSKPRPLTFTRGGASGCPWTPPWLPPTPTPTRNSGISEGTPRGSRLQAPCPPPVSVASGRAQVSPAPTFQNLLVKALPPASDVGDKAP